MKKLSFLLLFILVCAGVVLAQDGTKKRRPLPFEYGRVIINNYSEKAGIAPVVFEHWLHRSKFTCRLCHVDVAFAMKADGTDITASDNMKGYYCGTCHNDKMVFDDKTVFAACSTRAAPADFRRCERCHSYKKNIKMENDFSKLAQRLPRERFGNGINWEKAESDGLIRPVDFLEGVSIKRPDLTVQKDFTLSTKVEGMPNIIFSHKKHTAWNGCELCHPDIFIGVKKGLTKYSMVDIFQGKYCGVCHISVAFPLYDCQRCHTEKVQ
jgi:c(7)-type cytochrome triheme protein